MPMRLDDGWNQIQFNLSDFTRRAYGEKCRVQSRRLVAHACMRLVACLPTDHPLRLGTNYIETLRVQVHANCRVRRIYFSDRLYSEEELPPEFKLFLPIVSLEARSYACVDVSVPSLVNLYSFNSMHSAPSQQKA